MEEIVFNMRKMFGLGEFEICFWCSEVHWLFRGLHPGGEGNRTLEEMHLRTGRVTTSCGTPRGGKAQPSHEFDIAMTRGTLINNILHEEPKVEEHGWLHAPHLEELIASQSLLFSPPRMNGGHNRT